MCFVCSSPDHISIITSHVDDLGLFCNSTQEIPRLKSEIKECMPIKDLSEASQLLSIEIIHNHPKCTILFSHRQYIDEKV
jgi:hypothetical protein